MVYKQKESGPIIGSPGHGPSWRSARAGQEERLSL